MPEHHRRSIRLPGYDYSQPGAYFVTICTRTGECSLGEVVNGTVAVSVYGQIAEAVWRASPKHFPGIEIDALVVMPNHIHVVVVIFERAAGDAPAEHQPSASIIRGAGRGSLGAIVQNFKSVTARRINQVRHTPGAPVWQRNYYEHVIRTSADLERVRRYIVENPLRWELDELNPLRTHVA